MNLLKVEVLPVSWDGNVLPSFFLEFRGAGLEIFSIPMDQKEPAVEALPVEPFINLHRIRMS